MEFYLAKDGLVLFDIDDCHYHTPRYTIERLPVYGDVSVILEPVAQHCKTAKQLTQTLEKAVAFASNQSMHYDDKRIVSDACLDVRVFIPKSSAETGSVKIIYDRKLYVGDGVLKNLATIFGRENLSFDVTIKEFMWTSGPDEYSELNHQSKNVALNADYSLEIDHLEFPEDFTSETPWTTNEHFQMLLTIVLKLNNCAFSKLYPEGVPITDLTARNKVLLEEAVASDLTVIAENGTEIKCHKGQLMVCSKAFRAMFESKMKKEPHNRLEMLDMSEAGVRAMLRFIYYYDMEAALKDCEIGFELLVAANKYGISSLEDATILIMISREANYFSVEVTMRLAAFAKLLAVEGTKEEDLLKKAIKVLRVHFKNSSADFQASEEYQQVFQNDQKSGEELVKLFMEDDMKEGDAMEEDDS